MGHMDVTFDYLPEFERRAKALAKKYKSFPNDYQALLDSLENSPSDAYPGVRGVRGVPTVGCFSVPSQGAPGFFRG